MTEINQIDLEIKKLVVGKDAKLVMKCNQRFGPETWEWIKSNIEKWANGIPILVLPNGWTLEVVEEEPCGIE